MNPQTLLNGGGSRAAATSIIVNGFQPLTIITKRSILDVAVALDPPLLDWLAASPFDNQIGLERLTFFYACPSRHLTFSKLTIETLEQGVKYVQFNSKTPGRCHCRRSGVFVVNFEHISQILLVFLC